MNDEKFLHPDISDELRLRYIQESIAEHWSLSAVKTQWLLNQLTLVKAEVAGLGSELLKVQQDCIAERKLADRLREFSHCHRSCHQRWASYSGAEEPCDCGYAEVRAAYEAARK